MTISAQQVKVLCRSLGADLVGISPIERFKHAPLRISPQGHLPSAKSVIVAAVHTPDSAWELGGEPIHNWGPASCVTAVNSRLERIGMNVAKFLEGYGFASVPIPQTAIWRYRPFKDLDITFSPDLSHIHAAAAAGLGEIGFHGLLMTPEYGALQRFMTIITEADLEPDPLYNGPALCDKCMRCVKTCAPSCGLRKEVNGMTKVDIGGKIFSYMNKNKFRCAWAERFQLSFDADIPDTVDESVIVSRLPDQREGYGASLEPCWRNCVPAYSRGQNPNRNVPSRNSMWLERDFNGAEWPNGLSPVSRLLSIEVEKILFDKGVDIFGVCSADKVRNTPADEKLYKLNLIPMPFNEKWGKLSMEPTNYLKEATRVISFGFSFPEECRMRDEGQRPKVNKDKKSNHLIVAGIGFMNEYDSSKAAPLVESAMKEKIMDAILDVTRHLEEKGYLAIGLSYLPDNYVAQACGIGKVAANGELITDAYGNRQLVTTIITNAPLEEVLGTPRDNGPAGSVKVKAPSAEDITRKIKAYALDHGADMIGVAPAKVFKDFKKQLRANLDEKALGLSVQDLQGRMGGTRFDPVVEQRESVFKDPWDYLDDAQSVVVIGISWPEGIMKRAEQPPAEAVGPHSMFAQHCTWMLLNNLSFELTRQLNQFGYQAVPTEDLNGSASKVAHTFGEIVDLRANGFAAVAAGLAEIGWCGYPLTREYGKRQRFYAIVTNAKLVPDSMDNGKPLCKQCLKCAKACPVNAIGGDDLQFTLGERTWKQGRIDSLRCDWAKRYGLVGAEGPEFMGSQTNIMPPAKIDADALVEAMKHMDPLQKRIPCIVERCLLKCAAGK